MIEYHPYDLDIDGETDVNRRNIERIETATYGKEEIRFAVISDTQRWYDETEDAVEALNQRDDLDFVLHTGDMSDFGLKLEFECSARYSARKISPLLPVTCVFCV